MVDVSAVDHKPQITQPIVINSQSSPGGGGSPGARQNPSDSTQATMPRRVAESAPVGGYLESAMGTRPAVGTVGSLQDMTHGKSSPTHKYVQLTCFSAFI